MRELKMEETQIAAGGIAAGLINPFEPTVQPAPSYWDHRWPLWRPAVEPGVLNPAPTTGPHPISGNGENFA